MTIKVAPAVHEVTASYAVDEQRLELTVKLPADWPLHTIEIRDSRLVGVSEDRWRAWVLGVQQILTFRVSCRAVGAVRPGFLISPSYFRVEASSMA